MYFPYALCMFYFRLIWIMIMRWLVSVVSAVVWAPFTRLLLSMFLKVVLVLDLGLDLYLYSRGWGSCTAIHHQGKRMLCWRTQIPTTATSIRGLAWMIGMSVQLSMIIRLWTFSEEGCQYRSQPSHPIHLDFDKYNRDHQTLPNCSQC